MTLTVTRHTGFVFTFGTRTIWAGWFAGSDRPITHPEGKTWGAWTEDGEAFILAGPLMVAVAL